MSPKVIYLLDDLGLAAAFNYRDGSIVEQLREAAPDGIDLYFDNVAGDHLEAALATLRRWGRVAMCGALSEYQSVAPQPGPRNLFQAVSNDLTLRGSRGSSYLYRFPTLGVKSAAGSPMGDSSTARRSSTASRGLRTRSSRCCPGTPSARPSSASDFRHGVATAYQGRSQDLSSGGEADISPARIDLTSSKFPGPTSAPAKEEMWQPGLGLTSVARSPM